MTVSQLLFQIPGLSQTDPKTLIFAIFFSFFWLLPWTPPTHHPPASSTRAPGVALWKAAKNSHKKWFIALFLLNTLSILEILYIFVFSKRKKIARPSQTEAGS